MGIYVNDYGTPAANTFNTYYGGIGSMMPWLSEAPHANLLTSLTLSSGIVSPGVNSTATSYTADVFHTVTSITVTPISEDPKATITVNGGAAPGIYLSSFTLQGGADGAQDVLGMVNFSTAVTPESSSLLLPGTGLGRLVGGIRRKLA